MSTAELRDHRANVQLSDGIQHFGTAHEIDERARTRYGIFGKTVERTSPEDVGWWRYRVPGRGMLDWNRLIDTLYNAGYDGAIAVEHEDPVWGGTLDKTKHGLQIAAHTLRPLILAEEPAPSA